MGQARDPLQGRLLLTLYVAGAVFGPATLLALVLGRRFAWVWILPAHLSVGQRLAALGLAFAVPATLTALALALRWVHPLELTLPRPHALWTPLAAVGATALVLWGAAAAYGPGPGVAASLLAAGRAAPVWLVGGLLLPVAQAAFYFGVLPARLVPGPPRWATLGVVAGAFALSGLSSAAPLPAFGLALLLGLWLEAVRPNCGSTGVACALVVANLVALGLRLHGGLP